MPNVKIFLHSHAQDTHAQDKQTWVTKILALRVDQTRVKHVAQSELNHSTIRGIKI